MSIKNKITTLILAIFMICTNTNIYASTTTSAEEDNSEVTFVTSSVNKDNSTAVLKDNVEKEIENLKKSLEKESNKPAQNNIKNNTGETKDNRTTTLKDSVEKEIRDLKKSLEKESKQSSVKSNKTEDKLEISDENIKNPVNAGNPDHGAVKYHGTQGGVTWEIFEDGHLLFRPTNGVSGTFDDMKVIYLNYDNSRGVYLDATRPWSKYDNKADKKVKSISFAPGVKGGESLQHMFYGSQATSLDLSSFNTSNVTDMGSMFENSKATSLDLSSFNTSNVTNMRSMFQGSQATSLDLSSFDTSNVTNMGYMFRDSKAIDLDLSSFNTSNVTNMRSIFYYSKATSLDLSSFDTSNVSDMGWMFFNSSATSLDLSSFDTSSVRNMDYMFYGSQSTSLDLSSFNTSNVTDMGSMFENSKATSLDLSSFNTSNVTNMRSMFRSSQATSLDLSSFNTRNVVNMEFMFFNSNATSLDLSSFNTSNVTNMSSMFYFSKATSLDLSSFDTSNVTNMSSMLRYSKFNTIKLSPNTSFKSDTELSRSPSDVYTGNWIREDKKYGPWTSDEFMANYKGGDMAGTYVMEKAPTEYQVSFDGNGADGSMTPITLEKNVKSNLPGNSFTKLGYLFKGFSLNKDGSGTLYKPGQEIMNLSTPGKNITLYAIWEYTNETVLPKTGTFTIFPTTGISALVISIGLFIRKKEEQNKLKLSVVKKNKKN